jgi:preprotein translocase subunit Sss1
LKLAMKPSVSMYTKVVLACGHGDGVVGAVT